VTLNSGTLTVSRAPFDITAADAVRGYGSSNPAFTGTITGLLNGDNIGASYSTTATRTSPVGSYAIVPRTIDPDGKLGNYSLRLNIGTLTIVPAGITSVSLLANHHARVIGTGDAGLTYTVQATSDLVTWQVIGTATADANRVLVFEDADAGSFTARFYRAVLP